jgi:hypothetical protein
MGGYWYMWFICMGEYDMGGHGYECSYYECSWIWVSMLWVFMAMCVHVMGVHGYECHGYGIVVRYVFICPINITSGQKRSTSLL